MLRLPLGSLLLLTVLAPVRGADPFLPDYSSFRGQIVRIPMRDGKSLAADVYLPKRAGKSPVILVQTPYGRTRMRSHWTGDIDDGPSSLFADANYAFVVTDWRGRNDSKDAATAQPANLDNDGYDTVAWIVKQEWSDGHVGTWGASALGKVQYHTAQSHPPGLVCAVPIVMPLNLDYDIYFPGGVMWDEFAGMLTRLGFSPNLRALLAAHPLHDAFWDALPTTREIRPEEFRIPMLFIGGWYDIYASSVISSFQKVREKAAPAAKEHSKLIMGPWIHAADIARTGGLEFPAANHYGLTQAHAFFDYWLRNQKNDFDRRAPITYFQMGAGEWRTAESWPPAGIHERRLYLHPDNSLAAEKSAATAATLHFAFDPANPAPSIGGHVLTPELHAGPQDQREKVEGRPDVLVFTGAALEKPVAVAGKPAVHLYVASDRKDTDFTAILTDVYPDGRSMLIGEGIRRTRFRNSAAREQLLDPGEICEVTIDLPDTGLTWLPGHRIRMIVSSWFYPMFAVIQNDGGPMYAQGPGVKANNSVYADRAHPSALILPEQ